jgi:hypothetical protein
MRSIWVPVLQSLIKSLAARHARRNLALRRRSLRSGQQSEQLAAVGVAFDDIREVHSGPGENTPLVNTFAPLEEAIVSADERRSPPSCI